MSWFEEQLRYREQSDKADFEDAIDSIANAVMGTRLRDALSQNEIADSALEEILKYYHCKTKKEEIERSNGKLNNAGFIAKAPAALVEAEKAKIEKNTQMLASIEARIAELG